MKRQELYRQKTPPATISTYSKVAIWWLNQALNLVESESLRNHHLRLAQVNSKHIMRRILYIQLFVFGINLNSYCQDTIKVGTSKFYSEVEEKKYSGKGFFGEYGREDIIFSETHKKIEYCYYVNGKRISKGVNYWLVNDSTIVYGDSLYFKSYGFGINEYNYQKQLNGNYKIYKRNKDSYEIAEVKELMPLQYVGLKITMTADQKDTLWTTMYKLGGNSYDNLTSIEKLYKVKVLGEIYEYYQIDTPPKQLNGDSLPKVTIDGLIPCYCEPLWDIAWVSCIITKNGEIKNIDLESYFGCPYTPMEIIKQIKSWGKVQPSFKNGKSVNVRWFISVNNLSRNVNHPVFPDTKENRMRYINSIKK